MKKSNLSKCLLLICLLVTSHTEVRANSAEDVKTAGQEIIDSVVDVESLNQNVKKVGKIEEICITCTEAAAHLKLTLDAEKLDMKTPYYSKDNEPYIIQLKRTSKSPKKIDLAFKNGHQYCGKMFVGNNPWNPNGSLIIECMIHMTRYEDEEISLNLSNLKPLKEGEEEIIEVRLSKNNIRNAKYNLSVKNISTSETKVDLGKKFFGSGYNVSFDVP